MSPMRLALEANVYTAAKYMCVVILCVLTCMYAYIYTYIHTYNFLINRDVHVYVCAVFAGSLGPDILDINTTVGLCTLLQQFET